VTERTRKRRMHRYHDTCPLCMKKDAVAKGREPKRYRCVCGAVWRWNGKPGGPVVLHGKLYEGRPPRLPSKRGVA